MQQCEYKNHKEYADVQDARSHSGDDQRGRFLYKLSLDILRTVTGIVPKHIFDIGCRDACWFDDFKKDGIECFGIDISPKSVEYARKMGRNVLCVDAEKMVVPPGVDCVIMSHSIEHILNPSAVLKKIYDNTSDDTVLIVKCPDQGGVLRKGEKAHAWAWRLSELCGMINKNWGVRFYVPLRGEWFFILDKHSSANPLLVDDLWQQPITVHDADRLGDMMLDPWLKKKVDRRDRLKEKLLYIDKYLPEIKRGEMRVLDIGCGPSEFLESCRYFYNIGVGIDTPSSPMGGRYGEYSRFTHERQRVNVVYRDFRSIIENKDYHIGKFNLIHSQGAINQIMHDKIKWESLHVGAWKCDGDCIKEFDKMFDWLRRSLCPGGILMIYANSATNNEKYSSMVRDVAGGAGFELMEHSKHILHKWRRVSR